jgi:hypothetical protein
MGMVLFRLDAWLDLLCFNHWHVQRFSLTTNQSTVFLAIAYQPSEQDAVQF